VLPAAFGTLPHPSEPPNWKAVLTPAQQPAELSTSVWKFVSLDRVRPASTASEEKNPAVAPHADHFSVLSPVAEFFGNGQ
jgi:hypothetical protein